MENDPKCLDLHNNIASESNLAEYVVTLVAAGIIIFRKYWREIVDLLH